MRERRALGVERASFHRENRHGQASTGTAGKPKPQGPGSDPKITPDSKAPDEPAANLREQGDHANIRQNTTNRGHHQGKG